MLEKKMKEIASKAFDAREPENSMKFDMWSVALQADIYAAVEACLAAQPVSATLEEAMSIRNIYHKHINNLKRNNIPGSQDMCEAINTVLSRRESTPVERKTVAPMQDDKMVEAALEVFENVFAEPCIHTHDGDLKRMATALAAITPAIEAKRDKAWEKAIEEEGLRYDWLLNVRARLTPAPEPVDRVTTKRHTDTEVFIVLDGKNVACVPVVAVHWCVAGLRAEIAGKEQSK